MTREEYAIVPRYSFCNVKLYKRTVTQDVNDVIYMKLFLAIVIDISVRRRS
ncbi:hypothetical protein [Scytonema sp. NUACC26]|uniref:hypothetical protein n=1 Tax=Scytonema sp. NUACC26 TaxID=3140176 RepID=UPI0034DCA930